MLVMRVISGSYCSAREGKDDWTGGESGSGDRDGVERTGDHAGRCEASVECWQGEFGDVVGGLPVTDTGTGGTQLVEELGTHRSWRHRQDFQAAAAGFVGDGL